MNLSCIVLSKNSQDTIEFCLQSLSFCEEIIVIDDFSQDKTIEIAKKYGARVYSRNLNADFAGQRNFGLGKAKGKWVLFIDSDEEVPKALKNEIIQVTDNPFNQFDAYQLKRRDFFLGKQLKYGEWGKAKPLRLAKKGKGIWFRKVHEKWAIEGRVAILKPFLYHYPHPDLKRFLSEINFFSSLHSESNFKEGKRSNVIKIIFWPFAKFFYNWIIRLGFKDGNHGFVISLMMSFHSFLAWSKLWIKQRKN